MVDIDFSYGHAICCGKSGQGTGVVWLSDLKCRGNESSLLHCPHSRWGNTTCSHNRDAGVQCYNNYHPANPSHIYSTGQFMNLLRSKHTFKDHTCISFSYNMPNGYYLIGGSFNDQYISTHGMNIFTKNTKILSGQTGNSWMQGRYWFDLEIR